jgi:hypothetical protein
MGGSVRFDSALLSEYVRGKVTSGNLLKSERTPMEPNRYQRGSVVLRGKVKTWYGSFREDVRVRGKIERKQRQIKLGTLTEIPNKNAALNILAKMMDIVPKTDAPSNNWPHAGKTL